MTVEDLKLGKHLGIVTDRRQLYLSSFVAAQKAPPKTFKIGGSKLSLPMFANDRYGDCTCAAQAHRIVAMERSSSQTQRITLTDADVLAVYSAVTGFRADDPSTDNGAYCLDVLNYMRNIGMGREADGSPHTIGAYVKARISDHDQVRFAVWTFGGLYIGAGLPVAAQNQVGGWWDLTGDARLDRWGSWGGHAMHALGYDEKGVYLSTWGMVQRATWAWWDAYVDEAYGVISEDYIRRSGRTPQGFDIDQLNDALASIR